MNKMEDYKEAALAAKDMLDFALEIQDVKKVDKLGFKITISETYKGYYGKSSTYEWPSRITNEIANQALLSVRSLAMDAATRLENNAIQKAKEAREEAEAVLAAINNDQMLRDTP